VSGSFKVNGGKIVVSGIAEKDVLYNILGTGEQVAFTGGGGGTGCCNAAVDGTLVALSRNIALSPGLVNGQLCGGKNISIVSGSSVQCVPGNPRNALTRESASNQSHTAGRKRASSDAPFF